MGKPVVLDFGEFSLNALLKDTVIAEKFYGILPVTVPLTTWGGEAYGPVNTDLGVETPIPVIPPGGLAYTSRGGYLCIFYGQTPAWPVEYIGDIDGDSWKRLMKPFPLTVEIRKV
jgi:hypothetical protein